jgi:hypothetical protein
MSCALVNTRHGVPAVVVTLVAIVLVCVCATPLSAQWLHYPTAGVPKTATGKADLKAHTPKTADGKPDLSGIWAPEDNRPCPPPDGCLDMKVPQEFVDIGWSVKGGLPYQTWAADLVKARRAAFGGGDPSGRCLPGGIVKGHTTPLLRKVIQVPGLVVILREQNVSYRQIFTDGRPLPDDPQPSFDGYSSGRWEGDTLVVRTNGFKDGLWLDRSGSPLTESAEMTERFRRVNYGQLEIQVTVNDPKAYTRPWTVTLNHFIVLDTDLLDYVCVENEKDAIHIK